MKILIVTPRIPYPPYRGDKLKIFNLTKNLIKNNSVTILTFLRKKKQIEEVEELKKQNINIITIKISIFESFLNVLKSFFSSLPFQVAWYKSKSMEKKVYELLDSDNYNIAYFHLIRTAQYIPSHRSSKSAINVIDFTDAVSLYLNRFYKIEKNPIKKIFLGVEKGRIEKYESIANKFDTIFICSKVDREYLKQQGVRVNMKILRNGVDIQYFKTEKRDYDQNRIIFTGNMPYYANYDAAIYFSEEIFPLVLRVVPNAKFYIVGQYPPSRIRSLASENIIVTGFVADIKLEYLKSNINVAPMRFGAGTLNKIIESLVLGVPVIATPISVEGFPEEIRNYISVASGTREFADNVIKYLKEPQLRQQFMELDKSKIKELLSWENIVDQFENDLKEELKKVNN